MYEEAYYRLMKDSKRWFESSLLTAFVTLKMHKHHVVDLMFDICPYPSSYPSDTRQLPSQVQTLIVVGWQQSHYGFFEINIPNRCVLVKDGFLSKGNMRTWTAHIIFILRKWRLIKDATTDVVFCNDIVDSALFSRAKPMTAECVFEIICVRTVVQTNATECGPIAAYHAWEVIDNASKPTDVSSFRVAVIEELLRMWKDFDNCLRVRLKISQVSDKNAIVRKNDSTVPDKEDHEQVCYECNGRILDGMEDFEAMPCHHHYHINCIHERQRMCLLTMDGIVACLQCGFEIENLSKFEIQNKNDSEVTSIVATSVPLKDCPDSPNSPVSPDAKEMPWQRNKKGNKKET
jgi:hypothetical protein